MAGRGFPNLPYAEMNDVVKININMTQEQREILFELVQRPGLSESSHFESKGSKARRRTML